MENLLTVKQAAQRLHIAPGTVRRHLHQGLLRGKKEGRQWRVFELALSQAGAPLKTAPGASPTRVTLGREVTGYAASGALSDALARITAARAQLTTGIPMDAARDLAALQDSFP